MPPTPAAPAQAMLASLDGLPWLPWMVCKQPRVRKRAAALPRCDANWERDIRKVKRHFIITLRGGAKGRQ